MKGPTIKLHIEELVLHGFAPGDRHSISDAVQQELSRLFEWSAGQTDADVTSTLIEHSNAARIDAGAFQVGQNSKPGSIGTQVARAVHGELTK
jgi:hypothetical protein